METDKRSRGVFLMTADEDKEYKIYNSFIREEGMYEITVDSNEKKFIETIKCMPEERIDVMYELAYKYRGKGYGIASAYSGTVKLK